MIFFNERITIIMSFTIIVGLMFFLCDWILELTANGLLNTSFFGIRILLVNYDTDHSDNWVT